MADGEIKQTRFAALESGIWVHLGEQLRSLYQDLIDGELPKDLVRLTERLEKAIRARSEPVDPTFINDLSRSVPHLRAFALSLTRHPDQAEDLVQDAILRALDRRNSFEPGTSLQAWLFTILRNSFHSEYRKRNREVQDSDGVRSQALISLPDQIPRLELQDLSTALSKLPADQREAILMVGAEGMSYEDAAWVAGVPLGTLKSRVSRGRRRLAELLELNGDDTIGSKFLHR
jgi:RNA polymerase sigma-70 factor (ECF subfamily)